MHVVKHEAGRTLVSFTDEEFRALKEIVEELEKTLDGFETHHSFDTWVRWMKEDFLDSAFDL